MSDREKVLIHMKLPRDVIRTVDMWAAMHNLYRNEAAAFLLEAAAKNIQQAQADAQALTRQEG